MRLQEEVAMRRVRVRVHKGRVISPSDLPDDFEGELTLSDEPSSEGRLLLEETNRAYATLKGDPNAWEDERQERALWERTLADGLESKHKHS